MKHAVSALGLSIMAHALLAGVIVVLVTASPDPKTMAELDLSSVELSVSEEESPSEPMPVAASAAANEVPPPPRDEKPPEVLTDKRQPPDPGEIRMREPEETFVEMKTPPDSLTEAKAASEASQASEPTRPAPRQAHVDAPARPKQTIRPDYPKGARQRGESGRVVLEIDVAADGRCAEVRVAVSSGYEELDEAALKAVRKAKFTPAKSEGAFVASTARLALDFRLR